MSEEETDFSFSEDVPSDVRICYVLSHNGGEATNQELADASGMSPQLCRYHLRSLVRSGVVIRDDRRKVYSLQPFFYDESVVDDLSSYFVPMMDRIISCMDWSYVEEVGGKPDVALINCLRMFLYIANLDLRDLSLFSLDDVDKG